MTAYTGVRIADFSQGLAGPMAAMLLGDFDAEVAKVEPPEGDRAKDHPGYLAWNRNKQVVTLDLSAADGMAAARALIAGADVAIFDHAPGELEALGLDGASLAAAHPELVHSWMPPYGTSGTWSRTCWPPATCWRAASRRGRGRSGWRRCRQTTCRARRYAAARRGSPVKRWPRPGCG